MPQTETETNTESKSKPSKQLAWQKNRVERGECRQCGTPLSKKDIDSANTSCSGCRAKRRVPAREKYREKKGIEKDSPLFAKLRRTEYKDSNTLSISGVSRTLLERLDEEAEDSENPLSRSKVVVKILNNHFDLET